MFECVFGQFLIIFLSTQRLALAREEEKRKKIENEVFAFSTNWFDFLATVHSFERSRCWGRELKVLEKR